MKTLDPIDHIRANPQMYLRGDHPDPIDLARQLAGDAIYLGAKRAQILDVNGWLLVAADHDWIHGQDVREVFCRIVPFPEAGVNSMFGGSFVRICTGRFHCRRVGARCHQGRGTER